MRLAKEEDLPLIFLLRNQVHKIHVNGRPDIFKMPADASAFCDSLRACLTDENSLLLVYEQEETIIGYAVVSLKHPNNNITVERFFYFVEEFAIDEAYRGKGYGKAFMQEIFSHARENHAVSVNLDYWTFNETAAQFYHSLGMEDERVHLEMKL